MAKFFAKNQAPQLPPESIDELAPQGASASKGVPAIVAKMLSMIGLSIEDVTAAGDRIAAKANEYSDRLQRIETKLDLVASDIADLQDDLRQASMQGQPPSRAHAHARGKKDV